MNLISRIATVSLLLTSLAACSPKEKSDKAIEREKWIESLGDSIALYKNRIDSATSRLDELHDNVGMMLQDFEYVSNPREVEGYYIYKGWRSRYPLQGNGLVARISKDEGLELIACHKGATFNSISVSDGSASAASDVVPHDQALNYRRGDLTTVCFYGEKADSLAMFIADRQDRPVTVTIFNGGGANGRFALQPDAARMIAATWQLYSSQKLCERLELEIPMLNRRIDTCRRIMETNAADSAANRK